MICLAVWAGIVFLLAVNIAIYVGIVYFPQYTQINAPVSPTAKYIYCASMNMLGEEGC